MTINTFLRKEIVLLVLLVIMLINPFYYGYRVAVLLVFVLILKYQQTIELIDKNVFYLLIFGGMYRLIAANRPDAIDASISSFLPDIFLPSTIYLVGKSISSQYYAVDVRVYFLFLVQFFLSIIPILSIPEQIISDGFMGDRSLYLIWNRNQLISATGLGAYFSVTVSLIALLSAPKSSIFQGRTAIFIVVLFFLSMLCVFRLGNRTQLAITFLVMILSYFLNFRRLALASKIFHFATLCLIIGCVYYLFFTESEFVFLYQDRLGDVEVGESEFGGRLTKWKLSLISIINNPWGWDLSRFGYSHNLWLDVARVSGVLPLLPLMLFSVSSIKIFLRSLFITRNERFLNTFIFIYFISIILTFFVEPIMEGMYLLFFVFCLLIGFLDGVNKRKHGFDTK